MVEYHLDLCDGMIGTMQRKIPAIASMFACTHGMHWTRDVGLCLRVRVWSGVKSRHLPRFCVGKRGVLRPEWNTTW